MRQKTSDATYFLFLSTRLSLAAEEFKENWERHWHAILTMTCCFTQTLLMLCVAFAALHTHTHRQKVTHKALLIQPNTASLICSWESKPHTASYSLKRYFTKAFFPWGTQLDCLLCDSHTHTHTPPKTHLQSHNSTALLGMLKPFWAASLSLLPSW